MRIGLLSDTHGFLDGAVFTYLADCDEVWHAGDCGTVGFLDLLQTLERLAAAIGTRLKISFEPATAQR